MVERWWLVPGVIVEYHGAVFKIKTVHDNKIILEYVSGIIPANDYNNMIPRGVPFDNLQGNETEISFDDHYFYTVSPIGERHGYGYSRGMFPKEWIGKKFPITEELRRLLRMKENKKERHERWYQENLKILYESGIPFIHKGIVCFFREKGKKQADFYPHTGRWKFHGMILKGGATEFIKWYKK